MNTRKYTVRSLLLAGLFPFLAVSGCGSRTADVSGKVTYRQRALTTGTVSFYGDKGEIVSTVIGRDGTYHLPRVAPGSIRVAVMSHPRAPLGLQGNAPFASPAVGMRSRETTAPPGPASRIWTPIPEKYSRPEWSGLVFTVESGSQTLDLELGP